MLVECHYNPRITKPDSNPALDYSATRRPRRARWIWRITLAVFLVTAFGLILRYQSELWHRAQWLYWAHRCATHVTPKDTILVETDPAKAALLVSQNPDYVWAGTEWSSIPPFARELVQMSAGPKQAVYWPKDFREYAGIRGLPRFQMLGATAIAYMGERTSPAGHRRLVIIPLARINSLDVRGELSQSWVLPLPEILGNPTSITRYKIRNYSGQFQPMWLKPGASDPADASHVTIDFDAGPARNEHGMLDVYLRDDESLDVRFRDAVMRDKFQ